MSRSRDAVICWRIVNDVGILAEAGALWRIRRCGLPSCKRAFYARVQHQLFDTEACKEKWKTLQPAFKRHRAEYMKKRYHDARHGLSSTRRRKR
jgi:hypothetical protein